MNAKYTCIIIDDEPKAVELLAESISCLYDNLEVTGTYNTWTTALEALRNKDADIVFLDISMPQKTGIDLLDLVPTLKMEVIFVTAYTDYAVDAFSYNAAGYVLKPVKDKILMHAIDKALERRSYRRLADLKNFTSTAGKMPIPNNNGLDYIDLADIIFFEATARYTKVVAQRSKLISSYSIGRFKEILQLHASFYQVHRSYIINLAHIKRYERQGIIIMSDGSEIPLAKNLRQEFLALYH